VDQKLELDEAVARTAKLRAEEAKLLVEAESLKNDRRAWNSWLQPSTFVMGVTAVVGVATGVTQCQKSTVAFERAQVKAEQAEFDLQRAVIAQEDADLALQELNAQIEERKEALDEIESQLEAVNRALRTANDPSADRQRVAAAVREAGSSAASLGTSLSKVKADDSEREKRLRRRFPIHRISAGN
jgi:hypothetical protein